MHAHESRCSMPKKIIIIKIFTGAAVEGKGIPWLQYSEALGCWRFGSKAKFCSHLARTYRIEIPCDELVSASTRHNCVARRTETFVGSSCTRTFHHRRRSDSGQRRASFCPQPGCLHAGFLLSMHSAHGLFPLAGLLARRNRPSSARGRRLHGVAAPPPWYGPRCVARPIAVSTNVACRLFSLS
jgi:hypothetical protein